MKSKWFDSKEEAIKLRRRGTSIKKIEARLGIPRSTLSGWLKNVYLSSKHKRKLLNDWKNGLIQARKAAVRWHNGQKEIRLQNAETAAQETLSALDVKKKEVLDLAFAMLYLGEGMKGSATSMGNSDPLILKFFIAALLQNYDIDKSKIKCDLHLRADQDPKKLKRYWSKELGLPLSNFLSVSIDKRTVGSKTYPYYKGVCVLRCGSVAIQRKLLYLSRKFCQEVITMGG